MSEPNVTFHRVEDYMDGDYAKECRKSVICSFDTERFGYLQVEYDEIDGICELANEPDLNMLRRRDRKYIEKVVAIVWRMIFDAPAAKGRFR